MASNALSKVLAGASWVLLTPLVVFGVINHPSSYTSVKTPTPGQWNTNFQITLDYAEQNNIPIFMYLGATGCDFAEKGVKMIDHTSVREWLNQKKIMLVYKHPQPKDVKAALNASSATSAPDPDLYKAIKWVMKGRSSGDYPLFRIYWKKDAQETVSVSFSGRKNQMPVKVPAGSSVDALAGQLLGTLKQYLDEYTPGGVTPVTPIVDPTEPTEPEEPEEEEEEPAATLVDFGKKAITYPSACLFNQAGELEGVLTVKAAKANSRSVVKLTCKAYGVDGSTTAFALTTTKDNPSISGQTTKLGKISLTLTDTDVSGTLGDLTIKSGLQVGGTLATGSAEFSIGECPAQIKNKSVYEEALPNGQTLTIQSGRTITAGKNGSLKWNSKTKSLEMSGVNPSCLKIAYNTSTGKFNGSFKVYTYANKTDAKTGIVTSASVQKYTASFAGFIVDGVGYGLAKIKNVGTFDVMIKGL